MIYKSKTINGVITFSPKIYPDKRGYFFESYNSSFINSLLKDKIVFIQDNESKSVKNVIRGLHYQIEPFSQKKLIRVLQGKIFDVVLDLRKNSSSFGMHETFDLSSENNMQLYIPEGCAHGFMSLSDDVIINYKVDKAYAPEYERTILWNDPKLNIEWPNYSEVIVSEKDANGNKFENAFYF